jgi:Flp pilus assembly protein TadD
MLPQAGQPNWDEALARARERAAQRPDDPAAAQLLAGVLAEIGQYPESEVWYGKVLAAHPQNVFARHALAEVLLRQQKLAESAAQLQQVVGVEPANLRAWVTLTRICRQLHEPQQALAASQRAIALDPPNLDMLNLHGWNLVDLGRVREALDVAEQGIKVSPRDARMFWLRAFALLLLGDFKQGWENFEARWYVPELKLTPRQFPFPQWRGEDLRGKSIFLTPEQGMGDTLMFARYIPLLQQRGAQVMLAVGPELEPLLARSFPGLRLMHDGDRLPAADFHCSLMSLPLGFGTTLETVPANVPYLIADPKKMERWKARLSEFSGLKVGLAWAGRPSNPDDFNRTIPLQKFAPLASVQRVKFISLQKGAGVADIANVPELSLADWSDEFVDFTDTAALMSAVDLMISVCSAPAHLSGGLGRPTWVLLPFSADCRWMLDREDSPWYPTARLFRQPRLRDWDSVIERVAQELRRVVSEGRPA